MEDPGFLSGFVGKGFDIAISQNLHHAGIVLRCKKERTALREVVERTELFAKQIHQHRLEWNRKGGTVIAKDASAINVWAKKLYGFLRQAAAMVQNCTIPMFNVLSRYQTNKWITSLISEIERHLNSAALVGILLNMESRVESAQASSSASESASQAPTGSFFIEEALIVGQEQAFTILEKLVKSVFTIGGKTLFLKTLFNSQKVRDPFRTDQNMKEEDLKEWFSQRIQAKSFTLFLDDVWEEGGKLLEESGLIARPIREHWNYKIIVSSRNRRALLQMGVADESIITMGDLSEQESWELFAHHAFPYNNGNPPTDIIDASEWELAILRLPNTNSEDLKVLHDRLRWSYDAPGNYDVNLQLVFLCLSVSDEDLIIDVEWVLIPMWMGEGLLERNQRGHDPFEMGRTSGKQLADRCLIEPLLKYVDGRTVCCRMHDVLRDLAIEIAEQEENFYCRAGSRLTELVEMNIQDAPGFS